jgi:hypothetical protein
MKHREIKTLEDLRQRKYELKVEMKLTKQALNHSLRYTRMGAQRFLVYGMLLPLGLNSLAAMMFNDNRAQSDKPQWLLFVEQMVETISRIYDPPEVEEDEEAEGES